MHIDLTRAPDHPVGFDLVKDPLSVGVGFHVLQGLDQHIDGAGPGLAGVEDGRCLLGVADDGGDVPRAGDELRGHEQADLTVPAEEQDACA